MSSDESALVTALLSLPDAVRASVERALVPLARSTALGELAADVAHDVVNPLFGVLGIVDLLLEDATPGTDEEERLRLLHRTTVELKDSVAEVLAFARPADERPLADLAAATRAALALVRHGAGRTLAVDERYPRGRCLVRCPAPLVTQAALHLLLAARGAEAPVSVEVAEGTLAVRPVCGPSLGLVAAARIAADHDGRLELDGGAAALHLPPLRESRDPRSAD